MSEPTLSLARDPEVPHGLLQAGLADRVLAAHEFRYEARSFEWKSEAVAAANSGLGQIQIHSPARIDAVKDETGNYVPMIVGADPKDSVRLVFNKHGEVNGHIAVITESEILHDKVDRKEITVPGVYLHRYDGFRVPVVAIAA